MGVTPLSLRNDQVFTHCQGGNCEEAIVIMLSCGVGSVNTVHIFEDVARDIK